MQEYVEEKAKIRIHTPPHPRALAKSFPVPSGRTPTGGAGLMSIWSRMDRTHPAVPSPPQANTLRLGTLRNISNLKEQQQDEGRETKMGPFLFGFEQTINQ